VTWTPCWEDVLLLFGGVNSWLAAIDSSQTHKYNQMSTTEMVRINYWYGELGARVGWNFML
jgi:hypothetical protein